MPTLDEQRDEFYEMAHHQRCCQGCGKTGSYQSHHVIERSELRRQGRLDLLWDSRNCMRLCARCHEGHTDRSAPVLLRKLLWMHFEFAFEALGWAAPRYLLAKYAGDSYRLDQYREKWVEENG